MEINMDYQQAAEAAIGYVRGGEHGDLPAELAGLDQQGREQVLATARRHVAADATQIAEAIIDQRAADYLSRMGR